jgi:hypothetical protein
LQPSRLKTKASPVKVLLATAAKVVPAMPPKASACKKPATATKIVPAMPQKASACKKPATSAKVVRAMPPKASAFKKPATAAKVVPDMHPKILAAAKALAIAAAVRDKAKASTKAKVKTKQKDPELDSEESLSDEASTPSWQRRYEEDEAEMRRCIAVGHMQANNPDEAEWQGNNPDLGLTRDKYRLDLDQIMERRRMTLLDTCKRFG